MHHSSFMIREIIMIVHEGGKLIIHTHCLWTKTRENDFKNWKSSNKRMLHIIRTNRASIWNLKAWTWPWTGLIPDCPRVGPDWSVVNVWQILSKPDFVLKLKHLMLALFSTVSAVCAHIKVTSLLADTHRMEKPFSDVGASTWNSTFLFPMHSAVWSNYSRNSQFRFYT